MRFFGMHRTAGLIRTFVAALVLLAFTAQTYVTQTHIHYSASDISIVSSATVPHSGKLPVDRGDAAHCPLCIAMALAGHFISPAPATFPQPPFALSSATDWIVADLPADIFSHDWLGRAPPQA